MARANQTRKPAKTIQMPGQPPPSIHKERKPRVWTEEDIQAAMKNVRNGTQELWEASKAFSIPKNTLRDRLNGSKPRQEVDQENQLLSPQEERALVQYIKYRGWRGDPVGLQETRELAGKITGQGTPGEGWVYRFMKRNPDIRGKWAKKGESKRAQAVKEAVALEYFEILKEQIETYDIHPSDIYNADEKGIFMGGGSIRFRALVDVGQKQAFSTGDENRKMITVLECICVNGTTTPPLLIHEGTGHDLEWARHNPCQAR
ncbi:10374_t:CDS:1 [Acaulospora colombiana]|uniref:10374_t:CDS:1 n=1 Tax=Acaulospora colombiana TaxID=27376 RepID=A0ACA9NTV1_9GLOM|nr:10374_t:CDS:1 [Acaulospora colombiana]